MGKRRISAFLYRSLDSFQVLARSVVEITQMRIDKIELSWTICAKEQFDRGKWSCCWWSCCWWWWWSTGYKKMNRFLSHININALVELIFFACVLIRVDKRPAGFWLTDWSLVSFGQSIIVVVAAHSLKGKLRNGYKISRELWNECSEVCPLLKKWISLAIGELFNFNIIIHLSATTLNHWTVFCDLISWATYKLFFWFRFKSAFSA